MWDSQAETRKHSRWRTLNKSIVDLCFVNFISEISSSALTVRETCWTFAFNIFLIRGKTGLKCRCRCNPVIKWETDWTSCLCSPIISPARSGRVWGLLQVISPLVFGSFRIQCFIKLRSFSRNNVSILPLTFNLF